MPCEMFIELRELLRKSNINKYSAITNYYIKSFKECIEDPSKCCLEDLSDYPQVFSREATIGLMHSYNCSEAFTKDKLESLSRYQDMIKNICKRLFDGVIVYNAELKSRLAINTGTPVLPLNINIAWDPYFDIPYIPSSSLKGVVRSFFELNNIAYGDIDANTLFGSTTALGVLIFFDAYPVRCRDRLVVADVLAPHYVEAENRIDEASSKPRPLIYPTVAPGTIFRIIVALNIRNSDLRKKFDSKIWINIVNSIKEALETGIGAKTTLGYGCLSIQPIFRKP